MRRRGLQVGVSQRWAFFAALAGLWLSGALWLWLQRLDGAGAIPESLRTWKTRALSFHGLLGALFLVLLGTFVPGHVNRAWRFRRNRVNGGLFLGILGVCSASGFGLYYLSGESVRVATSWIHIGVGLALPVLVVLHIRAGRAATE